MQAKRNNLTDISTFVGIESIFRQGPTDPWAPLLAGRFADMFIYSDKVRYVSPVPRGVAVEEWPGRPRLALKLEKVAPDVVAAEPYEVDDNPQIDSSYIVPAYNTLMLWVRNNPERLLRWINLHYEIWVREGHRPRTKRPHLFDHEKLLTEASVVNDAAKSQVQVEALLYVLDVVLRYPLYGIMAGQGSYFVHHPIRGVFEIPGTAVGPAPTPPVCVSFQKSVADMAPRLDEESYIRLLCELRSLIRDRGLHQLNPGEVEEGVVREIAMSARLTPYLKDMTKKLGVAAAIVDGLGAIPVLGPASVILGGVVSAGSALWSGRLPRSLNNWSWLTWALKWKVEDEL